MQTENIMMFPQKSRISTSTDQAHTHVIKLWEDIGPPSEYTEEIDVINSCSDMDTIVLDICTDGGYGSTAELFERALRSCRGHTVAIIGPSCSSAGSIIALSCREFILDETSELMAHTSSYGLFAKDTDIFEHANFARKKLKALFNRVYGGFMLPEEIDDLIKGTPYYCDADDLEERLERMSEYRESQASEGCGDPDCTSCGGIDDEDANHPSTLDEIIELAASKALQKLLETHDVIQKPQAAPKEVVKPATRKKSAAKDVPTTSVVPNTKDVDNT
jgi:ATP-dependent protease ClpP protease subunit